MRMATTSGPFIWPTCQLDVDLHFTWSVAIVDDTKSNIAKLDPAALKFPDDRAYDSRDGIWINGRWKLATADRFLCKSFRRQQTLQLTAQLLQRQFLYVGLRLPSGSRFDSSKLERRSKALGKLRR